MTDLCPVPPLCVVSTHLDDAVLSCGHFLGSHPGTVVVTVMAGSPAGPSGAWDRLTTGQASAAAAVALRRAEDAHALAVLGAIPRWLDLVDEQYERARPRPRPPIVAAIARILDELGAASVIAPLGLRHPDHVGVADACLELAGRRPEAYFVYADMPYARAHPDDLAQRTTQLGARLLEKLVPADLSGASAKAAAVASYASQLGLIAGLAGSALSVDDPERYWRLRPGCPLPATRAGAATLRSPTKGPNRAHPAATC
ncbi:MAG: PIG-L deacetylase family protein [Acidimicrobiales bacterium]